MRWPLDGLAAWPWHDADLSDRDLGANEGDVPSLYSPLFLGLPYLWDPKYLIGYARNRNAMETIGKP